MRTLETIDGMVEMDPKEMQAVQGGDGGATILLVALCAGVVLITGWWAYKKLTAEPEPPKQDEPIRFGNLSDIK